MKSTKAALVRAAVVSLSLGALGFLSISRAANNNTTTSSSNNNTTAGQEGCCPSGGTA